MTSVAEAESKYGRVVRSAGGQIFGIERAGYVGRQEEKLTIGNSILRRCWSYCGASRAVQPWP